MHKHKFLSFIFVLFIATVVWGYDCIDVKAAWTNKESSSATIVAHLNGYQSGNGWEVDWKEGILKIDGENAYCADYSAKFKSGVYMQGMDTVEFLKSKSKCKTAEKAQEVVTKMALMDKYLKEIFPTNKERRYFFGQVLIWKELTKCYDWKEVYNGTEYQIDNFTIDASTNPRLLDGNDETEKNEYKDNIIDKAINYAEKNIKRYKGIGTTWYNENSSIQPLMTFTVKKMEYDYSIDAACTNCTSTNKNGAYLIQDTNDWEAIFTSTDFTDNNNLKNYYKKDVGDSSCNVYCREEYKVVYPNANNYNGKEAMNIEPGRYFTVNQITVGAMFKTGVFNFAPIKVTKTMQCKDSNNNQTCLNKVKENNDTGEIKYKFDENEKHNYDTEGKLEVNKNRTNTKKTISNNTLTSTTTKYYELPDNLYRYVDSSGKSYKDKPADVTKYRDMEISNLPISFENYNATPSITLTYSLPEKSNISKAFKNDGYFGENNTKDSNLYQKDKEGKLSDNEKSLIELSSCAKLYGYGSDEYKTCRNDRTENKTKDCRDDITKTTTSEYTCKLHTCDEGEQLCDNGECSKTGTCENPKCKIVGDKYYDDEGKETTKEKYEEKCPYCRIVNNVYYDNTGQKVDKETYYDLCPAVCKTVVVGNKTLYFDSSGKRVDKEEYDSDEECNICAKCNGGICCPDTDMVCPDENGNCPSKGGRKIIYRTIDLDNPFPYIDGVGRKTGANWCSYNIYTKKITCVNTIDNPIVSKHIINNRGIASKAIYTLDNNDNNNSLYTVTLDGEIINNIQRYNSSHEYDDNSLTCDKEGTCRSDFLRNEVTINGGRCADGGYDNLKTCAEES